MRKGLKKLQKQRKAFVGTFKRYGSKSNWHGFPEKTILFIDIKELDGVSVAEHIWFKNTKGFEKLGELKEGDKIQFDARVKEYIKGYFGHREEIQIEKPLKEDYKLNFPTKIKNYEK